MFSKTVLRALGPKRGMLHVLEIDFTGRTDFIFVRYLKPTVQQSGSFPRQHNEGLTGMRTFLQQLHRFFILILRKFVVSGGEF
jgi:hypothetical protein